MDTQRNVILARELVRQIEVLADWDYYAVWPEAIKEIVAALERRGMNRKVAVRELSRLASSHTELVEK